ncbi:MAG: flagellar biosynthesis regulator FlaF [Deltaproteobacteria bacterium]|nr:flagellar biosynthesis regulator FlaF [Deltaproteobacteria bacterium]
MQTQAHSLKSYESVENATRSGRAIEAAVLTKAAVKLKECQDNWDAPDREHRLDEALKYNQRIWSIFQSELSRDDHEMPKKLRLDILRLAAFIDRRLFETMAFPEPEKLNIVININNNLAAGLRGSPE